jgi:hypothetical protein
MVHRQSRDQTVKLRRVKRQALCVAPPELNIAQSGLRASGLGFFEHLFGGIERHHGYRVGRDCGRDDPRSASHIEEVSAPSTPERGSKTIGDACIGLFRPGIKRLSLTGKLVSHAFDVIHNRLATMIRCSLASACPPL